MEEEVEVGSIYEINHSKLPLNSPVQLNPIRVAMVLEKNDLTVSLRYPSMSSLQTHFNNHHGSSSSSSSRPSSSSSYRTTTKSRMIIPALDEKYVMSSSFAGDVLYRKIPSQEWVERRQSWSFWVVPVPVPSMADASTENTHMDTDVVLQKGKCSLLSELKSTAMVKWGKRQRVRFIGRHNTTVQNNNNSNLHHQSSSHIAAIDGDAEKIEPTEEEEEEKIEPTEEEEEEKIEPTEDEEEEKIEPTEEEEEEEKIEPITEDEEEEIEKVEEVGSRQIRKNRKRKCKTRQSQIQTQHRRYSCNDYNIT